VVRAATSNSPFADGRCSRGRANLGNLTLTSKWDAVVRGDAWARWLFLVLVGDTALDATGGTRPAHAEANRRRRHISPGPALTLFLAASSTPPSSPASGVSRLDRARLRASGKRVPGVRLVHSERTPPVGEPKRAVLRMLDMPAQNMPAVYRPPSSLMLCCWPLSTRGHRRSTVRIFSWFVMSHAGPAGLGLMQLRAGSGDVNTARSHLKRLARRRLRKHLEENRAAVPWEHLLAPPRLTELMPSCADGEVSCAIFAASSSLDAIGRLSCRCRGTSGYRRFRPLGKKWPLRVRAANPIAGPPVLGPSHVAPSKLKWALRNTQPSFRAKRVRLVEALRCTPLDAGANGVVPKATIGAQPRRLVEKAEVAIAEPWSSMRCGQDVAGSECLQATALHSQLNNRRDASSAGWFRAMANSSSLSDSLRPRDIVARTITCCSPRCCA